MLVAGLGDEAPTLKSVEKTLSPWVGREPELYVVVSLGHAYLLSKNWFHQLNLFHILGGSSRLVPVKGRACERPHDASHQERAEQMRRGFTVTACG